MLKKILLVEDTPDLRENFAELLTIEGFDVTAVSNGQEAMKILGHEIPDLIITDLFMRGLDGYGFIEKVKQEPQFKDIPVIVFSAMSPEEAESRARALGATRFVKKPTSLENLLEAIRSVDGF